MAMDKSEFELKLAAIRTSYLGRALPEQLAAVDESSNAFQSASTADAAMEALEIVHSSSHKLAGSSGTFGLPELSAVSRTLTDFTNTAGVVTAENYQDHKEEILGMVRAVQKAANEADTGS